MHHKAETYAIKIQFKKTYNIYFQDVNLYFMLNVLKPLKLNLVFFMLKLKTSLNIKSIHTFEQ